jgi:hypothetical protein
MQARTREARQGLSIGVTPMKRFHVHVAVDDLRQSIGFYSALFAAEPSVIKTDYAKWMLDDPRVNFAISTRGRQAGLDHLGIQAESGDELKEIYARLHKADGNVVEQGQTACCYAKSEKSWIDDPAQRAVSLHRQFGPLHHGGSHLKQARRGQIPRL